MVAAAVHLAQLLATHRLGLMFWEEIQHHRRFKINLFQGICSIVLVVPAVF